jgi:hypothetical protein
MATAVTSDLEWQKSSFPPDPEQGGLMVKKTIGDVFHWLRGGDR